jgi:adenosylhomocysteine nucleosidase
VSSSAPARRVAILAPMWPELRPLLRLLPLRRERSGGGGLWSGALGRVEVVAGIAGIGTAAAARAAERLLDAAAIDHLLVVGIAGAVAPSLAIGDLVVPERVLDLSTGTEHRPTPIGATAARGTLATSDALIVDGDALRDLERRGVVAIDMETAAIAAVCERRRCPWSVFRAISDRAGDGSVDPEILRLAGPDGRPAPGAVARLLATRPWRVPRLVRLARATRLATRAAASAAVAALASA